LLKKVEKNMETKDCKDFIESISEQYLLNKKDKWKRIRKYKEKNLVLRDFLSTSGDLVTVYETPEELLGVYSLELKTSALSSTAITQLSRAKFMAALSTFVADNFSGSDPVIDFSDLTKLSYTYKFITTLLYTTLETDIVFDLENTELTFSEQDGIFFLVFEAGGDWEMPVRAYFYWSEPHQSIRCFFPLGEGNTYNMETNTAYGSEDADDDELTDRYEQEGNDLDYETTGRIGLSQLQQHIERDYKNI
jgi:hypothetical protein